MTYGSSRFLDLVDGGSPDLPAALARALDDGPPVAVLPDDDFARERMLDMLRPADPVTDPDLAVIVSTSGSTGEPKGVMLSRAAIRASVAATRARIGEAVSWTLAVPAHLVAGTMVVARTVVEGSELRAVSHDLGHPGLAPEGQGPHRLSVVPTQLHRILDDPCAVESLTRFDTVLVGGGAASPAMLDDLRVRGVRVVTTYGMSETCGGVVYDGQALDGVVVACDPRDDRISLSTPTAFSGYHRRPDLTESMLTNHSTVLTQDRGRFDSNRLTVLGRMDDVVISGGVNVDLSQLELLVATLLETEDVAVTAQADPEWGARVVVLLAETGPQMELPELRELLRPHLEAAALPKDLRRLPHLPRLRGGKIDRLELRRQIGGSLLGPVA